VIVFVVFVAVLARFALGFQPELGKMVAPVVGRPLTQVLVSETKRNWPFVVGFAVTFTLVAKLSTSLDREYSLPFLLLFTSLTMLCSRARGWRFM
jgi:hypothetical protein